MTTTIKLSLLGGIAVLILPIASQAQSVEARWQPWIGCWAPVLAFDTAGRAFGSTARVCIAPAPGSSAAEVTTIYAGKVTSRIIIEANAEPHAVTRDGCEGTETAWWSQTGQRLYLRGALTCADGTRRSSSGVLSFSEHRQWLDVRGLAINGGSPSIAVGRFAATDAADSVSIPAEVRHATPVRTPFADYTTVAAASPITLADIAEVAMDLEESVASAWLVERARGLTLAIDGRKLAALADHGVPSAVIDVAVALAYPDVFGIASDSREAQRRPGVRTVASQSQRRGWYQGMPTYSSSCNPYFLSLDPWYYYGSYTRQCGYGYPYGYYGYGYGYGSPYGWYGPYSGTYYAGGPTVVVIQNSSDAPGHGRVVKGQGYTSGAGANGSAARPSGSYTSMTSGHGSISAGSGASSSASGSTSSSSSSGGGDRTAVRKP